MRTRQSSSRLADIASRDEAWARRARHRGAESASASGPETVTLLGVALAPEGGHHLVGRIGALEVRAWQENGHWYATVSAGRRGALLAHGDGASPADCEAAIDRKLEAIAKSVGALRMQAKAARQRRGS